MADQPQVIKITVGKVSIDAGQVELPGANLPAWMKESEEGSPAWKKMQHLLAQSAQAPAAPQGAAARPAQPSSLPPVMTPTQEAAWRAAHGLPQTQRTAAPDMEMTGRASAPTYGTTAPQQGPPAPLPVNAELPADWSPLPGRPGAGPAQYDPAHDLGGFGPYKPTAPLAMPESETLQKATETAKALGDMQREQEAKLAAEHYDAARRGVDLEYDYRRQKEEEAKRLREEDKKAGEARKDQSTIEPLALSTTDPFLRQAQQQTNAAAQSKEEAKRVDAARRSIDPEYAKAAQGADVSKALGKAGQYAGAAAQAGVPGAGAAGNILSGAMTGAQLGGPAGAAAGAIIAGANEINKALADAAKEAGKFGVAVASHDAEAFGRQLLDLAKKVPFAGEAVSAMGGAAIDVSNALTAEARRLSQFSGTLAVAAAEIDVQRTMRDLDRGERNAPALVAQMQAREEINQRIEDLLDKFLPTLTQMIIKMMDYLQRQIDLGEAVLQAGLAQLDAVEELLRKFEVQLPQQVRNIRDLLRQIANNTAANQEEREGTDFTAQLREAARALGDIDAVRETRERATREADLLRRARERPMWQGM